MTATVSPAEAGIRSFDARRVGRELGIYVFLAVLVVFATIVYPGFLSWDNISAVISQNAALGIIAVGMTLVIISGGFDLSVGAVYAVSATLSAMVVSATGVTALGLLAGLGAGLLCGLVNAVAVTLLRVNPFIATLGSSTLFSGIILILSDSNSIAVRVPDFRWLGRGEIGPIPVAMIALVVVVAAAALLLNFTVFGRRLLATGGNSTASRLAGVRTSLVQGATYVICSVLAAFAGFLSASQLGVGQGNAGATMALQAIAVVVVGGTSLLGGEGSILRTVVGLLILATLNNIFFSLAVDTNWQGISQGLIIIAAVAIDQLLRRRQRA